MADRIVEVHDGGGDGGSGALTAVVTVLLVVVLLAVLYFMGAFRGLFGSRDTHIDVNIQKPGVILLAS